MGANTKAPLLTPFFRRVQPIARPALVLPRARNRRPMNGAAACPAPGPQRGGVSWSSAIISVTLSTGRENPRAPLVRGSMTVPARSAEHKRLVTQWLMAMDEKDRRGLKLPETTGAAGGGGGGGGGGVKRERDGEEGDIDDP
jgi:hypothetical protein